MIAILRLRIKVPGQGARLSRVLGIRQVSQSGAITADNRDAPTEEAIVLGEGALGTVINYGVAHTTEFIEELDRAGIAIINHPTVTAGVSDKKKCLEILREAGVPCLEFTSDVTVAESWARGGSRVFCRTLTRAKKGKGIVIASSADDIVKAPLYTKDYEKTHEHRVHVFVNSKGKPIVIDYVQKKRCPRVGGGKVDEDVRNWKNGWYFSHKNRRMSKAIKQAAVDAIAALGLDFGAVDILSIWKDTKNKKKFISCAVCEVNTAPGMRGTTTFNAYCEAIKERTK